MFTTWKVLRRRPKVPRAAYREARSIIKDESLLPMSGPPDAMVRLALWRTVEMGSDWTAPVMFGFLIALWSTNAVFRRDDDPWFFLTLAAFSVAAVVQQLLWRRRCQRFVQAHPEMAL